MRRIRRRPQAPTKRVTRQQRRTRPNPTNLLSQRSNGKVGDSSNKGSKSSRSRKLKFPKWFDPNTEATGRFIVSIFRSDMRQAGRDIVDIIGEILDKR